MTRHVEFFSAVASRDTARVREFLGSDPTLVRAKDPEGATALHVAAEHGHRDVVKLLLEASADINARDDRFGATPSGWAIEYLREQGGLLAVEIEDTLFAIRERDARWVRRLLTRWPALAKATDTQGKPLSLHASESGDENLARLFVDRPRLRER